MATKLKKMATKRKKMATKPNVVIKSTGSAGSFATARSARTAPAQRTMSKAASTAHATETVKCGACES
eukprot:5521-Pleurochrysis_carterae.AAC.1